MLQMNRLEELRRLPQADLKQIISAKDEDGRYTARLLKFDAMMPVDLDF